MTLNLELNDLIRIAAAGGGLALSAQEHAVDSLIRIAAAASTHKARIQIEDAGRLSAHDLIRIAAAGGGCVIFV